MFYAFLYYVSSEIVIKDYSTHGPSFFMPLKEFFLFFIFLREKVNLKCFIYFSW